MWLWKKKEPQIAQTQFGEFVKQNGEDTWECFVQIGDVKAQVLAGDTNGQPNPELLNHFPFVIQNLHSLENMARETVQELSAQHFFNSVSDSPGDADFSLGFDYEEENWGETVYVDFKDGKVTSWSSAD